MKRLVLALVFVVFVVGECFGWSVCAGDDVFPKPQPNQIVYDIVQLRDANTAGVPTDVQQMVFVQRCFSRSVATLRGKWLEYDERGKRRVIVVLATQYGPCGDVVAQTVIPLPANHFANR